MTEASKTGGEAGFYLSVTGDFENPVYFECQVAKDLSSSRSTDKKESNCRETVGQKTKKYIPGTRDESLTLEVCHRTDDACWAAICDAEENCSNIEVLKLDCKIDEDGASGRRYMANIFEYQCEQPLEDEQNDSFEFAPTACTNDPVERVVATGGVVTAPALQAAGVQDVLASIQSDVEALRPQLKRLAHYIHDARPNHVVSVLRSTCKRLGIEDQVDAGKRKARAFRVRQSQSNAFDPDLIEEGMEEDDPDVWIYEERQFVRMPCQLFIAQLGIALPRRDEVIKVRPQHFIVPEVVVPSPQVVTAPKKKADETK